MDRQALVVAPNAIDATRARGATRSRSRPSTFSTALGLLLFITVSRVHDYVPLIGLFRPAVLLFAFCVIYPILRPSAVDFTNLRAEWPAKLMLAMIATSLVSAFLGLSVTASLSFLQSSFSRVLSLFLLLVIGIRSVRDLRHYTRVYVLALLVTVFFTFVYGDEISYGGYTRVGGTVMYDGNDLGVVYVIGIPLALIMARIGRGWERIAGLAALIGVPAAIALSASRGAFLGLAACALGLLVLSPGVSIARRVAVIVLAAIALSFAAPQGYWGQMATILDLEQDYNVTEETGRIAIWKRGMGYVAQYPVFGVGPDNFVRAGWLLTSAGREGLGLKDQVPHNTFLQFWAELGTVGFGIVAGTILGGIVALFRLRRRLPRAWLRATPDEQFLYLITGYLPVSILSFTVAAFFVSHAYLAMYYVLVAFLCGTLMLAKQRLSVPRLTGR